jgi:hypothetical protein
VIESDAGEYPHEATSFFEQIRFFAEKYVGLGLTPDTVGLDIMLTWKKRELWTTKMRREKENNERWAGLFQSHTREP